KTIFTESYDTYKEGLSSYAFFKINNKMTSEDLVQHAFMKTWMYMLKGGEIKKMKAFLYRVLNNLIIDEYRKHKTTSLDAMMEEGYEPTVVDPKDIVSTLDSEAVLPLIDKLPDTDKKVMQMKYIEHLSLDEMSKIDGVSKKTISVKIRRGIDK